MGGFWSGRDVNNSLFLGIINDYLASSGVFGAKGDDDFALVYGRN